jgi:pyruvate,water dikinase
VVTIYRIFKVPLGYEIVVKRIGMKNALAKMVCSGSKPLDKLLQGLHLGDNVVWQVDSLDDYSFFAQLFAEQVIRDGFDCVYLRFAPHSPILNPTPGLTIIEVDPSPGFDYFSSEVHRIVEERGRKVCYVFDNLSALVNEWATDELLANFFQVTCPYLFKINAVAYFALTRGQHSHGVAVRVHDTTQVLIDVYHVNGNTYIHPLKVWNRYSSQMFLPHLINDNDEEWEPVFESGDAAMVLAAAVKHPLTFMSDSIAPWDSVYRKLIQYQEASVDIAHKESDIKALKQKLSRMMIGNHVKLNKLSDRYLASEDLLLIKSRLIGSGQIGGKTAGMLLARRVLEEDRGEIDFAQVLEEHDSFYIGSDVFFTFLVKNDLFQLWFQLSKDEDLSWDEFAEVERRFLAGKFPADIMEQFRDMLDYYGQAPIIVRSSSLLEDSFEHAFAGKYRSEFCANQGSPEERLGVFLLALKLVYASALNPDALSYRRKRGLGKSDEQMAILVQRVSGIPYREYFFPNLAGVAFSRNLYAWSDRIDPSQGLIRLVLGLGTRAVNRVGGDYPRMIAISHPRLRPEADPMAAKYSQHNIDLIDLKENEFATKPFTDMFTDGDYPNLHLMVSTMAEGYLQDPLFGYVDGAADNLILTFSKLIEQTAFVRIIGEMLAKLESAWGQPVDIEFTAHIDSKGNVKVNLLQCRSLRLPTTSGTDISIPDNLSDEQVLFRSNRAISAGAVSDIRYIVYIDPRKYAGITGINIKKSLGRVVGRINERVRSTSDRILAMGPGRWGSSNIELGVNVSYADIDNISVLVEVAREETGHKPEVSYGTHFFQDLVEAKIVYLPVYPDDGTSNFNTKFFEESPNVLPDLLPDAGDFKDVVHVIDVPSVAKGAYAQVVADPQTQSAVCFLK